MIYFELIFTCVARDELMLFMYGYLSLPVPFDEKNILSALNCF